MKNTFIVVFFLVFVLMASVIGRRTFLRVRHAGRLRVGVQRFRILSLSLQPISNIVLSLGNFSSSTFTISQIQINAYTMSGTLLATQTAPLPRPFVLKPNVNSTLPLDFTINAINVIAALKTIGGLSSVAANFISTGKYGLPIILKGFIESDNIQIPINEPITI